MHPAVDFTLRFLIFAAIHSLLITPAILSRCYYYIPGAQRWMRLFYTIVSIIVFGWVLMSWPGSAVIYVIPGIGSLLFYILQLTSLVLLVKCVAQLGIMQFLGIDQPYQSTETRMPLFITTGCYAKVRHPQFSLGMVFLILNPVMTTKWLLLTILSGLYLWWGAYTEEKRIGREAGVAYQEYQRRVPMFIPAVSWEKHPSNQA